MSKIGRGIVTPQVGRPALEVLDNEAVLDFVSGHLALLFNISPTEARYRFKGLCERTQDRLPAIRWIDLYQDIVLGDLTLWAEMLGVPLDVGEQVFFNADDADKGHVNLDARTCDEDGLPEM